MIRPTNLILDSYSHPGISLFWKRHGLSVMEQLVPNDFLFTCRDIPLEKLIEKEIWSGWKKIVLIGTQSSIRRGFNVIMNSSLDCRNSISVGFWPIDLKTLIYYASKPSINLRPILQVFKAGHTILVDVPKVKFHAPKKENKYFWENFYINSTHDSSKTNIFINDQNFKITGEFRCRVAFHEEFLNSLTMHPNKLTRTPLFKVFLRQKIKKQLIQRSYKLLLFYGLGRVQEKLLSTGKNIEISGNWANLSLALPEVKETVDSAIFEVEKKSLSMIIPAKPIHSKERYKKFVPAFHPSNVVANNSDNSK